MTQKLTYSEAYGQLENLVAQIEDDNLKLDELAEKVKAANELIAYCETKLWVIENEVKGV